MHINRQRREISLKVVYYGPGFSGKTTNLEKLHQTINPKLRSPLTSMQNQGDRTLFFDYMQLELGKIGGMTPRFNLYTVPGQPQYAATRKIVLRGADALVFVADSGMARIRDNVASWKQMHEQMEALNIDPADMPVVVQMNKRDLSDALPMPLMKRMLKITDQPVFEAIAIENKGTRETLQATIKTVFRKLKQRRSKS